MSPVKDVDNECTGCGREWVDKPGQFAEHYNGCPECGSLYWQSNNTKEAE